MEEKKPHSTAPHPSTTTHDLLINSTSTSTSSSSSLLLHNTPSPTPHSTTLPPLFSDQIFIPALLSHNNNINNLNAATSTSTSTAALFDHIAPASSASPCSDHHKSSSFGFVDVLSTVHDFSIPSSIFDDFLHNITAPLHSPPSSAPDYYHHHDAANAPATPNSSSMSSSSTDAAPNDDQKKNETAAEEGDGEEESQDQDKTAKKK